MSETKKRRQVRELQMTQDEVTIAMRSFRNSKAYEIIEGLKWQAYKKIYDEMLRTKKPELMHVLDGFHKADVVTRWADRKLTEEVQEAPGEEDQ